MNAFLLDERIRFLIAGGLASLVNWLVRFPLSAVLTFWAAVSSATAIGMCAGFILYRTLIFKKSDRPIILQICDFVLVNLGAGVTAIIVAVILSEQLPWPAKLSNQIQGISHLAGIAAGAIMNYFGHKFLTFR